jgi:hypothetical protein
MRAKIVKLPKGNFPEWIKIDEEYEVDKNRPKERGFTMLLYKGSFYKIEDCCLIDAGSDDYKQNEPLQISVPESQLKAFRKAAILAKEYCQEALVEHEKKVGRSILRKEIILEEGLKKDLTFLGDVIECFEDIFPEDYE